MKYGLLKTGILLFCDAIWLYFGLILITSLVWNELLSFHPLAWIAAPLLGYIVGSSTKTLRDGWAFFIHCMLLAALLLPHWTFFYEDIWFYSFWLSLALAYLYIRSSIHVSSEPTRLDMLLRFEGTIVFYLILVLVNQNQQLFSAPFHVLFFLALISSLLGMMLTLYENNSTTNSGIETKTAGNSTSFPVIIGALLAIISIVSLLLLIPNVQTTFVSVINGIKNGAIWVGSQLYSALIWFLNLFPNSDVKDPELPPSTPPLEAPDKTPLAGGEGISLIWIITPLIILAVLIALWISSRLLRKRRPSAKASVRKTKLERDPFWKRLWHRLGILIRKWKKKWRQRYPDFYAYRIYWHFYKLTKWAKTQGISRQPQETPQEFSRRMVRELPLDEEIEEKILELGKSYSATHYSAGTVTPEYDEEPLREYIKKHRRKNRDGKTKMSL